MEKISKIWGIADCIFNVTGKFAKYKQKFLLIIPKDKTWKDIKRECRQLIIELFLLASVTIITMLNILLWNCEYLSKLISNDSCIHIIVLLIILIYFSRLSSIKEYKLCIESARIAALDVLWLSVIKLTETDVGYDRNYMALLISVFVYVFIYKLLYEEKLCFQCFDVGMKIFQVVKWLCTLGILLLIIWKNSLRWILGSVAVGIIVCLVQFFYIQKKDISQNVVVKIYTGNKYVCTRSSIQNCNGMLKCTTVQRDICLINEDEVSFIEYFMLHYPSDTVKAYIDVKCTLKEGTIFEFNGGKVWSDKWFYFWEKEKNKTTVMIIPIRRIEKIESKDYKNYYDERKEQ